MSNSLNSTHDSGNALGIFAKFWEPGKVKTRLANSIGELRAAKVYEAFVAATIARLSSIDCHRTIAYSPSDEATRAEFEAAEITNWSLVPQADGDLGQRMKGYFDTQFATGARRVLLLGTDSPNVPLVEVQEAFEHLKTSEVVLGPTSDGGYYLIGAAEKTPPIFDDIPWSSPAVFSATVDRLQQADMSYAQLDPWYDVDEMFDLHQLIEDLQDERDDEPSLEVLLRHVLEVIEA